MPFNNDIIGGTKLLIPAIRSPNYIAGVQGWSINKDGTVEFASGTFRGPVVVIDPLTQAVVASIGANGNISGQTLSAASDIFLGNLSLADYFAGSGKGLVAEKWMGTGALPSTGNSAYVDTAWIEFQAIADRYYWINCVPLEVVNPGGPVGTDQVKMRLNMASSDGGFNGTVLESRTDVDEQVTIQPSFMFYADVSATQRVQLALWGQGVVMTVPNPQNSFKMFVVEIAKGPGVTHTGGTGTATGAQAYTKQYVCTGSRSYDGTGAPITSPDADNNVYQSDFPDRSFGNERAYMIFPMATLRSDISGGSVTSIRLWTYCFKSEDSSGSLRIFSEASGTLPATYNPGNVADVTRDNAWPLPGWESINLSAILSDITGGDNAIGMPSRNFGVAATGFRGYGFQSDLRPYIEVKYTK